MRISKRTLLVTALVASATSALGGAAAGTSAPFAGASVGPQATAPPNPIRGLANSLKGLTPRQRETRLYNLAKQEGRLEWYTSLSRTISPEVVKAFEAKYSGLKVSLFRASSEDLVARVTQEAKANAPGADVIETNGTEMTFFQRERNILVPYRASPYAAAVPRAYRFDGWTGERIEAFVVAYNRNLVSGRPPRTFAELGTSRWAGKLSMEPGDVDWFAALYTQMEKDALSKLKKPGSKAAQRQQLAKVRRNIDGLFQRMARNSQVTSGHTTQATLLAAGQFAVCVSCHAQSIQALAKDGAPITFKPFVNPIIIRAQGIGIAYRLRHPATALLFYDWMLRKDGGQTALLRGGANPARRDMGDPDLAGAKRFNLNLRPIIARYGFWSKKYDQIIRLGKSGG
jgi:iron(III) transport system substrate-binding protein